VKPATGIPSHGVLKPTAFGLPQTEANQPSPIALSESQMLALLAASYPLPSQSRGPFLEACAKELAAMPELGDGVLHRTIVRVQRMFFDPPVLDSGRMPRVSKWER
jgi:hypothetical protein